MQKNTADDDVWYEIFLRLPFTEIFNFKSVNKVWSSTLSCPNFISHWYNLNYSSLPWALIDLGNSVKNHSPPEDDDNNEKLRRVFAITCPDSCSQFLSQHQNGFSFDSLVSNFPISRNDDVGRKSLYLMGSSNGLVLCNVLLPDQRTYCVCNPLTQKWVSLPPPPSTMKFILPRDVIGLICSVASTSLKVIRIPEFEAETKQFKVEMFSSEAGEWNVYDVSCLQEVTWSDSLYDNLVTHNGVFYWFQKGNNIILAVSVEGNTNHDNDCRLINLPDRAMDVNPELHHHLGESEGSICYAIVNAREKSLSVWALKEDWCLLCKDNEFHKMLMETLLIGGVSEIVLITNIQILGFNPFDKNVVILSFSDYIWAYNTKTKGYEQLSHPSFLRSRVCWPRMSIFTFAVKPWPTVLPPISW